MTTFNTNTDRNAPRRWMETAAAAVATPVRRLADRLAAHLTRMAPTPERTLEKAARREAARRAVDNLLR